MACLHTLHQCSDIAMGSVVSALEHISEAYVRYCIDVAGGLEAILEIRCDMDAMVPKVIQDVRQHFSTTYTLGMICHFPWTAVHKSAFVRVCRCVCLCVRGEMRPGHSS